MNAHPYNDLNRTARCRRARFWLILMFLALRIGDVVLYFGVSYQKPISLAAPLVCDILWTTPLLGAIWYRRLWARYALIALLFLEVLGIIIAVPLLLEKHMIDSGDVIYFIIPAVIQFLAAAVLIAAPDIRRLTRS